MNEEQNACGRRHHFAVMAPGGEALLGGGDQLGGLGRSGELHLL